MKKPKAQIMREMRERRREEGWKELRLWLPEGIHRAVRRAAKAILAGYNR